MLQPLTQEMHMQQMKDLRSQAAQRGPDLLLQLSEMACTPVELTTLFNLGKSPTPDMLMDFAQFLHRELSIRMAQRAVEHPGLFCLCLCALGSCRFVRLHSFARRWSTTILAL